MVSVYPSATTAAKHVAPVLRTRPRRLVRFPLLLTLSIIINYYFHRNTYTDEKEEKVRVYRLSPIFLGVRVFFFSVTVVAVNIFVPMFSFSTVLLNNGHFRNGEEKQQIVKGGWPFGVVYKPSLY